MFALSEQAGEHQRQHWLETKHNCSPTSHRKECRSIRPADVHSGTHSETTIQSSSTAIQTKCTSNKLICQSKCSVEEVCSNKRVVLLLPSPWLVMACQVLLSQRIRHYWWPPVVASYVEVLQVVVAVQRATVTAALELLWNPKKSLEPLPLLELVLEWFCKSAKSPCNNHRCWSSSDHVDFPICHVVGELSW